MSGNDERVLISKSDKQCLRCKHFGGLLEGDFRQDFGTLGTDLAEPISKGRCNAFEDWIYEQSAYFEGVVVCHTFKERI